MQHTRRQFLLSTAVVGMATGAVRATSVPDTSVVLENARTPGTGWHVAMVGDSIFDNARYVPGKPSVIEQIGQQIGGRGKASLLARDGDVTTDVADQVADLAKDVTHIVVSVGGNDALQHTGLLDKDLENSSQLFAQLAKVHTGFKRDYAKMLRAVVRHKLPLVVCTIYDSNFEQPQKQLADVALTIFNDAILRCAGDARVPVVDLRRIFTRRTHYANAIEPSELGGAKMVKTIVQVLAEHDFTKPATVIYA